MNCITSIATQVRLDKVRQRLNKIIYPSDKHHRFIVKKNELLKQKEKYSNDIWRQIYEKGFIPLVDNDNPKFIHFFEELSDNAKQISSICNSIAKCCKKYNLDEKEVMFWHSRQNMRHKTSF